MENIGWITVFVGAGILMWIIAVWRMLRSKKSEYELQEKKNAAANDWQHAIIALGVSLCLIGAFLMFHGSILGERTTGIATVVGITGIGIICTHGNKRVKR